MKVVDADEESHLLQHPDSKPSSFLSCFLILIILLVFLASVANVVLVTLEYTSKPDNQSYQPPAFSPICSGSSIKVQYTPFYGSNNNSTLRFSGPVGDALIRNVIIWTVNNIDQQLSNYDVLIQKGIITQVAQSITPPGDFNGIIVDGQGRYLTPGLIDLHSHVAAHGFPSTFGTVDNNETPTSPSNPQLRAIDSIDPLDPGIGLILSGGVTTSLVLPGSGNVMGGEAAYIKMRGKTVGRLLIPNAPRALKMACGENPKRVYGNLNTLPASRMGIGWEFRRKFYDAAVLRAKQQQWTCSQSNGVTVTELYPQDLELEPLVGVLSGDVNLMIHCYKVEDMEMVIRTSHEFNFTIAAFHHANEAYKITDLLRENNIAVATWPDHWGFKMESYSSSVHALAQLVQGGVAAVIKTDHPVLYGKYLIYEAAKAYHWGLTWQQAIRAVTATPAAVGGIFQRTGSVEERKDGDVVLWDRFPLDVGASPTHVFIDGNLEFSRSNFTATDPTPNPTAQLETSGPSTCTSPPTEVSVIRGVSVYALNNEIQFLNNATIVVDANGTIICLAEGNTCESIIPTNPNIYTINGGFVTPGLINTGSTIGQVDVTQEYGSGDGVAGATNGANIRAVDGIKLTNYLNTHVINTLFGGVTTIIASPQGTNLVSGQSAAFYLLNNTIIDNTIISSSASLDINIGSYVSNNDVSSVSSQIAELRSYFNQAVPGVEDETLIPFRNVLDGIIPLVAYVHQIDEINSIIRLQREFGFKLIINGGAEAHLIANKLAAENISVILNPIRQPPDSFQTWNVREDSAFILYNAGVKVGISQNLPDQVSNIRWEAAFARSVGVPDVNALEMVTKNVAEMYNLDVGEISVGKQANFVVFNGDPLSIKTNILLLVIGNRIICQPQREK